MSTLLLMLRGNMSLNGTIWPPRLYVYDDLLIYKKRKFFRVREITISYNQISGVETTHGLLFAQIEIFSTGVENVKIRYIYKSEAKHAKKIIDQKIYHSHAKHHTEGPSKVDTTKKYELSVARLNELKAKGLITEREFVKKRNELLKEVS